MLKDNCTHPQFAVQSGQRYPLRYGSSATDECTLCGAFRLTGRIKKLEPWQPGPLSKVVAERERQIEQDL
jgi:hypothetical protein